MGHTILFAQEVYAIVGAAMEVHRELGSGFYEAVYQQALELEFSSRNIPFQAQSRLNLYYKDQILKKYYIPDLLCFDQIVVELKSIPCLTSQEYSQLINYLKATRYRIGILINFGQNTGLEWKRLIY